jgi:hypothetical protein
MDAAAIQAKIYRGYGLAASRLGYHFAVYRPSGPENPLDPANIIGAALPATFTSATTQDFNFNRSNDREVPDYHCMADMTGLAVSDIFVSPDWGTYFIIALDPLLPPRAIRATQAVNVTRPAPVAGFGAQPYGGSVPATEVGVMTGGWPAAILSVKARGEGSEVNLPGDVRTPGYTIYMPSLEGTLLRSSDIIVDSIGRRFIISSAELTDQGWNLVTRQAET